MSVVRSSLTDRFAAAMAARSMDGLLGAYAGEPDELGKLRRVVQAGGMLAYLSSTLAHGVLGVQMTASSQIVLLVSSAVASGALAISIRGIQRSERPSRETERYTALVQQFELSMVRHPDRPSEDLDPGIIRKMAKLTASLPGAVARRSSFDDSYWIRPEGHDTEFKPVKRAEFDAFCHMTKVAGRRLTVVEVAGDGLLARSYQGGQLQDLMPDRPAVMHLDRGGLAVESWDKGVLRCEHFIPSTGQPEARQETGPETCEASSAPGFR